MEPALQARLVRLRVHRARAREAGVFLRRQLQLDLARDRRDDVVLEREHVAQVALVPLGPQLRLGVRVHELRGDPHPVAGAQHRPGDQRVHAQLLGDLVRWLVGLRETHHRPARDDALQAPESGEVGDQCFVETRRQVVLPGVAREVREREHRKRAESPRGASRCEPPAQAAEVEGERQDRQREHRVRRREPRAAANGAPHRRRETRTGVRVDGLERGQQLAPARVAVVRFLGQTAADHRGEPRRHTHR